MDQEPSRTRTEASRSPFELAFDLLTRRIPPEPGVGQRGETTDPRRCLVCKRVLDNHRPEAQVCGGRCRMARHRTRQAAEAVAVREKLTIIEQALAQAAAAVAALRKVTDLGGLVGGRAKIEGGAS